MKTNPVSNLLKVIRSQIENEGPLSIAEYMNLCLTHPKHGYYTTAEPIGKSGDFVTASEISQMFGELIGIWCMQIWQQLGAPKAFNLVELGPGNGTLMQDLLRATKAMPEFLKASNVHLVEINPKLIEKQKHKLANQTIIWVEDISEIPDAPTILIANEFLDALPFRQWTKLEESWYERAIEYKDGKLEYAIRPNRLDTSELPPEHTAKPDGSIFETAPARAALISNIAHLLKAQTGAALFIDYGHLSSGFGDTFQAMHNHSFSNALENPGKTDLTSHVDFAPLLEAARAIGCNAPNPTTQSQFLLNLGLLERAGTLGSGQNAKTQKALRLAVERLAGGKQMGELFKVMSFGSLMDIWLGFE